MLRFYQMHAVYPTTLPVEGALLNQGMILKGTSAINLRRDREAFVGWAKQRVPIPANDDGQRATALCPSYETPLDFPALKVCPEVGLTPHFRWEQTCLSTNSLERAIPRISGDFGQSSKLKDNPNGQLRCPLW